MKLKSYDKYLTYKIFFGTLANTNRLKIVNALRDKPINVSELCKKIGFEQTMVSHNLKRLERCGMIFRERKGKYIYFSLNKDSIGPLLNLIDSHMKKYCCEILAKKGKTNDNKTRN